MSTISIEAPERALRSLDPAVIHIGDGQHLAINEHGVGVGLEISSESVLHELGVRKDVFQDNLSKDQVTGCGLGVEMRQHVSRVAMDSLIDPEQELQEHANSRKAGINQAWISQENAVLKQELRTDPGTGILNRYALTEDLSNVLDSNGFLPKGLTLVFIDLDNFKKVNTEHGHARGDRALELAAKGMQEAMRSDGTVYRWGGDEFVVVVRDDKSQLEKDIRSPMIPVEETVEQQHATYDRRSGKTDLKGMIERVTTEMTRANSVFVAEDFKGSLSDKHLKELPSVISATANRFVSEGDKTLEEALNILSRTLTHLKSLPST